MNLSAFHSTGLWLAVTTMPPASSPTSTAICAVGVGTMPRSTTFTPDWASDSAAAFANMGPDWRESRASATRCPPRFRRKEPNAPAYRRTTSSVRSLPPIPRRPLTERMRLDIVAIIYRLAVLPSCRQVSSMTRAADKDKDLGLATRAVHAGQEPEPLAGA